MCKYNGSSFRNVLYYGFVTNPHTRQILMFEFAIRETNLFSLARNEDLNLENHNIQYINFIYSIDSSLVAYSIHSLVYEIITVKIRYPTNKQLFYGLRNSKACFQLKSRNMCL